MEAFGAAPDPVEATEQDQFLMTAVHAAFDSCSTQNSGLPSLMKDIKDLISHRIQDRASARNLTELFNDEGQAASHSMNSMLASMLVAVIKQKRSTLGSRQPVYLEEVEMMLEQEGLANQTLLDRCMGLIP